MEIVEELSLFDPEEGARVIEVRYRWRDPLFGSWRTAVASGLYWGWKTVEEAEKWVEEHPEAVFPEICVTRVGCPEPSTPWLEAPGCEDERLLFMQEGRRWQD